MTDPTGSGGAWHPDPLNRYSQRWWDGSAWTDQVIDATGQTITDPMGVTAAPAVDATVADPTAEPGATAVFGAPPPPGAAAAGAGAGYGATPTAGYSPAPVAPKTSNGLAIAALVLGVGSLLFFWIPFVGLICVPFALGAIVCGVLGMSAAKKNGGGKGLALAGLVTGVIALVGAVMIAAIFALWVNNAADDLDLRVNTDPVDGVCNQDRWLQDPDCGSSTNDSVDSGSSDGVNSDPSDGVCNEDRWLQDPDC